MAKEDPVELNITDIFDRMSSNMVRSLLVDLSAFATNEGGRIVDVIAVSQMIDSNEELKVAYDELKKYGLIERGDMVEGDFVLKDDGKRLRLSKGVQNAVRRDITKEI